MIEARGDIFGLAEKDEVGVAVITTNGFVKINGKAVMGRGCALKALQLYPGIDVELGKRIKRCGNVPHVLRPKLVTFPVKPALVVVSNDNIVAHMKHNFSIGDTAPGWAARADPTIIEHSAKLIVKLADASMKDNRFYLPRPGCGAGELCWKDVRQILSQILDDRFACCTFNE